MSWREWLFGDRRLNGAQWGVVSPWAEDGTLAKITADHLWPELHAVVPMDRSRAMGIPAVARVRLMLCGMAARLPLIGMAGAERMSEQPLVCRQPEPGRPLATTMQWWLDSMLFYGRAWNLVLPGSEGRYSDGRVRQMLWVPEWAGEYDKHGNLVRVPAIPWAADGVAAEDVKRIDGPHPGILNYGQDTLRRAHQVEVAASRGEANPVPAVELHQTSGEPMNDAQIDRLIARWAAARKGQNGGVGYTNANLEMKVHGQPAEQLLIDGRNAAALNVARMAGVPAWVVDASVQGTSLNYSNTPSRNRELIDYALAPYLTSVEARLSLDDILPHGQWCRADTTDLTRGDFNNRMVGYATAIAAGIYTAAQCRAMENGTPVEDARDGDEEPQVDPERLAQALGDNKEN